MEKIMAEMLTGMIDSINDSDFKKKCPHCKSDEDVIFDKDSGWFDCFNCMKRFL